MAYAECLRFELLDETPEELARLVQLMDWMKQGKAGGLSETTEFTRGHYSKGVE